MKHKKEIVVVSVLMAATVLKFSGYEGEAFGFLAGFLLILLFG